MCVTCPEGRNSLCCKARGNFFELEILAPDVKFFWDKGAIFLVPLIAHKGQIEKRGEFFQSYMKEAGVKLDKLGFPNLWILWGIMVVFPSKKCSFLDEGKNLCKIYPERPFVCRTFPYNYFSTDNLSFVCEKCAGKIPDIKERRECLSSNLKVFRKKLNYHRKITKFLTEAIIEKWGKSFIYETYREIANRPLEELRKNYPINIPATILFNVGLPENASNFSPLRKQIEILEKLKKVNPANAREYDLLIGKYREVIDYLSSLL